jgi:hypothetical protein
MSPTATNITEIIVSIDITGTTIFFIISFWSFVLSTDAGKCTNSHVQDFDYVSLYLEGKTFIAEAKSEKKRCSRIIGTIPTTTIL